MSDLQTFLTTGVFAFMLAFTRIGTSIMVMPGIGNTFVPANIRLYFALGFAFVFFPVISKALYSGFSRFPDIKQLTYFIKKLH